MKCTWLSLLALAYSFGCGGSHHHATPDDAKDGGGGGGAHAGSSGPPAASDSGMERSDSGTEMRIDGSTTADGGVPRATVHLLTAGRTFSCLLDHGVNRCWGLLSTGGDPHNARGDAPGELGAALPEIAEPAPTRLTAANYDGRCDALEDDTLVCHTLTSAEIEPMGRHPLPGLTDLAMGPHHICMLQQERVRCWGSNGSGALGVGTTEWVWPPSAFEDMLEDRLVPVDLGTDATAVALGLGDGFSCALLDDGRIKCWGENALGQLGLGDTEARGDQAGEMGDALPAAELGSANAVALASQYKHSCAVLADGAVKCWGENMHVKLGADTGGLNIGDAPGELGDALPAVPLSGPAAGVAVAADASCALLQSGAIECWGAGPISSAAGERQPGEPGAIDLGSDSRAVEIALGEQHGCARFENGEVRCWGSNAFGQLGLGDRTPRDEPARLGAALAAVPLDPYVPPAPAQCGSTAHITGVLDGDPYEGDWPTELQRLPGVVEAFNTSNGYLGTLADGALAVGAQSIDLPDTAPWPLNGFISMPGDPDRILCLDLLGSSIRLASDRTDLRFEGIVLGDCAKADVLTGQSLELCDGADCVSPIQDTTGSVEGELDAMMIANGIGASVAFGAQQWIYSPAWGLNRTSYIWLQRDAADAASGTLLRGLVIVDTDNSANYDYYCVTAGSYEAGSSTSTRYHLTELRKLGRCDFSAERFQLSGCTTAVPAEAQSP